MSWENSEFILVWWAERDLPRLSILDCNSFAFEKSFSRIALARSFCNFFFWDPSTNNRKDKLNIHCSWHQKWNHEFNHSPIHKIKVLPWPEGQRAFKTPHLMVYYFLFITLKNIFRLVFHFKDILPHFKFMICWILEFVVSLLFFDVMNMG